MREDARIRRLERVLWLCLAVAGLAVLGAAMWVQPDSRGFGTHTQLGLPPCGFLVLTGFPCPGCGLTTAFAHGIRGQWIEAGTANPLGLLLFVVVCLSIPTAIAAAYRAWSFQAVVDRLALHRWALGVAACGVLVWIGRLASLI